MKFLFIYIVYRHGLPLIQSLDYGAPWKPLGLILSLSWLLAPFPLLCIIITNTVSALVHWRIGLASWHPQAMQPFPQWRHPTNLTNSQTAMLLPEDYSSSLLLLILPSWQSVLNLLTIILQSSFCIHSKKKKNTNHLLTHLALKTKVLQRAGFFYGLFSLGLSLSLDIVLTGFCQFDTNLDISVKEEH